MKYVFRPATLLARLILIVVASAALAAVQLRGIDKPTRRVALRVVA